MNPIQQAAKAVIERHGGVRPASRALLIDVALLSRLANGKGSTDDPKTLRKLGLELQIVPLKDSSEDIHS